MLFSSNFNVLFPEIQSAVFVNLELLSFTIEVDVASKLECCSLRSRELFFLNLIGVVYLYSRYYFTQFNGAVCANFNELFTK